MGKFWSVLFALVLIGCGATFAVAPAMGWWLPENVSTHGGEIDHLFYVIFWVTTFFFVLTEAILVIFMWRYGSNPDGSKATPGPSVVGSLLKPLTGVLDSAHKVEIAWTIVPAVILLYIAFAQVPTWARVKYQSRMPQFGGDKSPLQIDVSARQFEWRMRYPSLERAKKWLAGEGESSFKEFIRPQFDDVYAVNELHVVKHHTVLVHLSTRDVLHSFNLPNFRVKQDALPGKTIPVWFTPTKSNVAYDETSQRWIEKEVYDIPCAELCGWGHYRMIGRVFVHENKEDFLAWLEVAEKYNTQHQASK